MISEETSTPKDGEQANSNPSSKAVALPPYQPPSIWWDVLSLFIKVIVISLVFIGVFTFIYGFHRNNEQGMSPTIRDGDLVLFNRRDTNFDPGDLLLLDFQGQRQVRRVIALPGDVVDITETGLFINGSRQHEPYIFQETWQFEYGITFPITVPPGQVFVLGDARESSTDSRIYGTINTSDTLGKAIAVLRRRGL